MIFYGKRNVFLSWAQASLLKGGFFYLAEWQTHPDSIGTFARV